MPVTVIEGEQRGDEGKGRFVDMLMPDFDIGARFNGGRNAGHTVVRDGIVYKLHGLPTSALHPHATSVVGNGTAIDAISMVREIETLEAQGVDINPARLLIDNKAHLTLPSHISRDEIIEGGDRRQGSTKSGIGPVYSDKAARLGVRASYMKRNLPGLYDRVLQGLYEQRHTRVEERLPNINEERMAEEYVAAAQKLGVFVTDATLYLLDALDKGKRILAEGAQAFLLDVDHGMYPYTTSSSTISGGVTIGLGVPPQSIEHVIGITKATQSHVGGGPFVTEITDSELSKRLHGDMGAVDAERGTTTGRTRRLGHLDLPQIRRSQRINGTDEMALTKLDWLARYEQDIPVCVAYRRKCKFLEVAPSSAEQLGESTPVYELLPSWKEDIQHVRKFEALPEPAQNYIKFIEEWTNVPIKMIGVGPEYDQVIVR